MKILAIGDFHGKFLKKLRKLIEKENPDLIVGLGDYGGIRAWYGYLRRFFKSYKEKGEYISAVDYFGKEKYKELLKKDEKAVKSVLRELNSLGKNRKILFVFGNTDDEWYNYPFDKNFKTKKSHRNFVKKLKNMKEITYSKTKFRGINFIGFGGYVDTDDMAREKPRNKDEKKRQITRIRRREKSKKRLFENLKKAKGEKIFVFHYPPKGIFDIIKDKKNPYFGSSSGIGFFMQAIRRHKPGLVLCGHMHEYQGKKKIGKSLIVNPGAAVDGKAAVIEIPEKGKDKGKKKDIKVRFVR